MKKFENQKLDLNQQASICGGGWREGGRADWQRQADQLEALNELIKAIAPEKGGISMVQSLPSVSRRTRVIRRRRR